MYQSNQSNMKASTKFVDISISEKAKTVVQNIQHFVLVIILYILKCVTSSVLMDIFK